MRVVAIGGAGAMGKVAVRTLATNPSVTTLVIADREISAATALVAELNAQGRDAPSATVEALELDLTNSSSLASVVAGADLVVNTSGPFYRFGATVLSATIEAGAHYLDICDDPEPTMEMLAFDEAARAAGVVAIIGMGASPGVSNLLARLAGDHFGSVDRIITGWPVDAGAEDLTAGTDATSGAKPSAASVHWVHQFSHPITQIKGGKHGAATPLEEIELDYPDVDRGIVYTVGHPEAVTLNRAFPELQESANVMVISPDTVEVLRQVAEAVRDGMTDEEGAAEMARLLALRGGHSRKAPGFGWIFAYAEGRDGVDGGADSEAVAVGLLRYPRGGMAGITGVPLAIGTGMVLDGLVTARGVHSPETAIDPTEFFVRLEPHLGGRGEAVLITKRQRS